MNQMVEFKIRINPAQRITYFPKTLVEQFGHELRVFPNTNAAIFFSKDSPLEFVIESVELLLADLRLKQKYVKEGSSYG